MGWIETILRLLVHMFQITQPVEAVKESHNNRLVRLKSRNLHSDDVESHNLICVWLNIIVLMLLSFILTSNCLC